MFVNEQVTHLVGSILSGIYKGGIYKGWNLGFDEIMSINLKRKQYTKKIEFLSLGRKSYLVPERSEVAFKIKFIGQNDFCKTKITPGIEYWKESSEDPLLHRRGSAQIKTRGQTSFQKPPILRTKTQTRRQNNLERKKKKKNSKKLTYRHHRDGYDLEASGKISFKKHWIWGSDAALRALLLLFPKRIRRETTISYGYCSRIPYTFGLPWWRREQESTSQCRTHKFDPWSGKIPHAMEQLSPCAITAEPML